MKDLFELAKGALQKSYSPYSKFRVGAAVRITETDELFSGCNVENASYGGTCCAERVAIFHAIAEMGSKVRIKELVVITERPEPVTPCGICRQVISEFALNPDVPVHCMNPAGIKKTYKMSELLPYAFQPSDLD